MSNKLTAVVSLIADKSSGGITLWKDQTVNIYIERDEITVEGNLPIDDLKSLIHHLVTNLAFYKDKYIEILQFKY